MALWRKKSKEKYWPEAKLLLAYHLYRTPEKPSYLLSQFRFPVSYPRSLQSFQRLPDLTDLSICIKQQKHKIKVEGKSKKLEIKLREYTKWFRGGRLDHPTRSYFSFDFAKEVLMNFLNATARYKGRDLSIIIREFRHKPDEFHRFFKARFPEEFFSWSLGESHFPFLKPLFRSTYSN